MTVLPGGSADDARAQAEARRQRILQNADRRLSAVRGDHPVGREETQPPRLNSARIQSGRRIRHGDIQQSGKELVSGSQTLSDDVAQPSVRSSTETPTVNASGKKDNDATTVRTEAAEGQESTASNLHPLTTVTIESDDESSFWAAVASVPKGTPNRWKIIATKLGLPVDEVRKRAQPHLYNKDDDNLLAAARRFPRGTPHRWQSIAEEVGLPQDEVRRRLQAPSRQSRRSTTAHHQAEIEDSANSPFEGRWFDPQIELEHPGMNMWDGHRAIDEDDNEELLDNSPVSSSLGRVLVVSDEAHFEIQKSFYAKAVVAPFEAAGYHVEAWKLGLHEVIQALERADFNILVLLGADVDDYDGYFFHAIQQWVGAGGMLLVHGEGHSLRSLFNDHLDLGWSPVAYRRLTHERGEPEFLPERDLFLKLVSQSYNVKAIMLNVPKANRVFSIEDSFSTRDTALCPVAATPLGDGAVVFFGDVNAEGQTIHTLLSLCLTYKQCPPCANCRRVDTSSDRKLHRCSRCNITHYCDRSCQKKHWKAHKAFCSTEGLVNLSGGRDSTVDLDVKVPPSVSMETANIEYSETMLQETLCRELLAMGVPLDANGNFLSPFGDETAPSVLGAGSRYASARGPNDVGFFG